MIELTGVSEFDEEYKRYVENTPAFFLVSVVRLRAVIPKTKLRRTGVKRRKRIKPTFRTPKCHKRKLLREKKQARIKTDIFRQKGDLSSHELPQMASK
jgi:hypothetical protein